MTSRAVHLMHLALAAVLGVYLGSVLYDAIWAPKFRAAGEEAGFNRGLERAEEILRDNARADGSVYIPDAVGPMHELRTDLTVSP